MCVRGWISGECKYLVNLTCMMVHFDRAKDTYPSRVYVILPYSYREDSISLKALETFPHYLERPWAWH